MTHRPIVEQMCLFENVTAETDFEINVEVVYCQEYFLSILIVQFSAVRS